VAGWRDEPERHGPAATEFNQGRVRGAGRLRLVVSPLLEGSIEAITLHHGKIRDTALEVERSIGEHKEEQHGQHDQCRTDA